jgi:hypothetical protein
MKDNFDIVSLYKHYSKNILAESNRYPLSEKEVQMDLKDTSNRFKATVYFEEDPTMLPASFQIDYVYDIKFNAQQISNDFSEDQISFDKEVNVDDDEIDRMIMKKLQNAPKASRQTRVSVDLTEFYNKFFKRVLPSYVITNKLNDFIRAGVIPIDTWKIYAVTYSTQVDDKLLFRKIETGFKKNPPIIQQAHYGYQIAFESANSTQTYSKEQVMEFAEKFSKALEDSLFKDTKYYEIIKR